MLFFCLAHHCMCKIINMTHREYWQRLSEIKNLTQELGEAWDRFDTGIENIRSHLANSRKIIDKAKAPQAQEEFFSQLLTRKQS